MKNMRRVLRQSWRGEGAGKVIDFKSDGRTPRVSGGSSRIVSTDTETLSRSRIIQLILSLI